MILLHGVIFGFSREHRDFSDEFFRLFNKVSVPNANGGASTPSVEFTADGKTEMVTLQNETSMEKASPENYAEITLATVR